MYELKTCYLMILSNNHLIKCSLFREMDEITAFIKGAICDDQCLGRCLYIHGVPGTGKVKSLTTRNEEIMHSFAGYLCIYYFM